MKTQNRARGNLAEGMAATALAEKGFQIIERNFANKFGEIDIIAIDHGVLVFIEVKAKTSDEFGLPEEMINKGKLQRIRNMAIIYMEGKKYRCRIDVVAIVLSHANEVIRLTHYENVY